MMADKPTEEEIELIARNTALRHAMQSAIRFKMENGDTRETDPKHLRTGLNANMCGVGALAKLLIEKGIFTNAEYFRAENEMLEQDIRLYEQQVEQLLGVKVTFG